MLKKLDNSHKKEIEKIFKESEVMVLIESMDKNIRIIAEGHSVLERGLNEVKGEVAEIKSELSEFRVEVDERFERIEANQEITLEYLSRIDEEISGIKSELSKFKEKGDDPKWRKGIEVRVAAIENMLLKKKVSAS